MGIQHISDKGLNLIKSFEGCRLESYLCPAGKWTIGYGHTAGVTAGTKISQIQADEFLRNDLNTYEGYVRKYDEIYHWTQNQFDALTSFTYNCGAGNLKTLLANGSCSIIEIANALPNYNKGNGQVLQGLVRRRAAEQELFLSGTSNSSVGNSTVNSNNTTPSISSVNQTVKGVQNWLNTRYNAGLKEDNEFGPNTLKALTKAWQKEDGTLSVDGSFGPLSQMRASNHTIQKNSTGIFVTIWQALLVCRGYNPNGIDGNFGSGCLAATLNYQKNNNLIPDGCVGRNTWIKVFQ